ncbi:hypothetical protein GGR57DRAFT_507528 [Xylariaceae sp. FL1272]|nr:hypothetical protein GGR57DRAFT_507528 [Xylariaceae sp. FL1272]
MAIKHSAKRAKVSSPKKWVDFGLHKSLRADEFAPYYNATLPSQQFVHQAAHQLRQDLEVKKKVLQLERISERTLSKLRKDAVLKVKAQWEEQDIWKKSWDELIFAPGVEGIALLRDTDTSNDISEDRWEHENNKNCVESRPINMFLYQVQQRLRQEEMHPSEPKPDISTTAYEAVLNDWRSWNIWDDEWGVLPGLRWRHEGEFDAWALSVDPKPELYEIPTPPELQLPEDSQWRSMNEFDVADMRERLEAIQEYKDKIMTERRGGKPPKDYTVKRLDKRYREWRYEQ